MQQHGKKELPSQSALSVQSTLEKRDFSKIHSQSKSKAIMCVFNGIATGGGWGHELHLG